MMDDGTAYLTSVDHTAWRSEVSDVWLVLYPAAITGVVFIVHHVWCGGCQAFGRHKPQSASAPSPSTSVHRITLYVEADSGHGSTFTSQWRLQTAIASKVDDLAAFALVDDVDGVSVKHLEAALTVTATQTAVCRLTIYAARLTWAAGMMRVEPVAWNEGENSFYILARFQKKKSGLTLMTN